jgi:hypothetical protein
MTPGEKLIWAAAFGAKLTELRTADDFDDSHWEGGEPEVVAILRRQHEAAKVPAAATYATEAVREVLHLHSLPPDEFREFPFAEDLAEMLADEQEPKRDGHREGEAMSIVEQIAELRAAGMRLANGNQQQAVDELATMTGVQVKYIRNLEAQRADLEAENERLREALSPSAKDLADRVRRKVETIRILCERSWIRASGGARRVLELLPEFDALANEIELLTGDGADDEPVGDLTQLEAETDKRKAADAALSQARIEINQAKCHLRGTLGFVDGVPLIQMAKEAAGAFHRARVELATLRSERDEYKAKRLDLGRQLSDKTEEWIHSVELAERAVAKMEKTQERAEDLETALREVDSIRHEMKDRRKGLEDETSDLILQLKAPCMVIYAAKLPTMEEARDRMPTPSQNTLVFGCPAGCEHKVNIPLNCTVAELAEAVTEQTGMRARKTKDGAFTWEPHEPPTTIGIIDGEPVKTIAEYSEDITDPLATAHNELELIICQLDGDKAWDFSGNSALGSPGKERDLYISSLETFMAAMLKWAQGMEGRHTRPQATGREDIENCLKQAVVESNHQDHVGWLVRAIRLVHSVEADKEDPMKDKTLHNTNSIAAHKNVSDLQVYGGDLWRLLCKASSEDEGWMKSTKVMGLWRADDPRGTDPLGCLVQVTTQQRHADGSYCVAEAVTFVPGACFNDFDFPETEE